MGRLTLNVLSVFCPSSRGRVHFPSASATRSLPSQTKGALGRRRSPPPRLSHEDDKIAVVENEAERGPADSTAAISNSAASMHCARPPGTEHPNQSRLLATGATPGRRSFGRGSLFYLLRNRFYIGEVKIQGRDPARRTAGDHGSRAIRCGPAKSSRISGPPDLLCGNASDPSVGPDFCSTMPVIACFRPTHTKAGVRYRYYVSLSASAWRIQNCNQSGRSRVFPGDPTSKNIIVKSLNEHLVAQKETPAFNLTHVRDGKRRPWSKVARIDCA